MGKKKKKPCYSVVVCVCVCVCVCDYIHIGFEFARVGEREDKGLYVYIGEREGRDIGVMKLMR